MYVYAQWLAGTSVKDISHERTVGDGTGGSDHVGLGVGTPPLGGCGKPRRVARVRNTSAIWRGSGQVSVAELRCSSTPSIHVPAVQRTRRSTTTPEPLESEAEYAR